MSRETDIKLLMDDWEEKHKNNGYKRFIRDGIVCEEKWEAQHTPRVGGADRILDCLGN